MKKNKISIFAIVLLIAFLGIILVRQDIPKKDSLGASHKSTILYFGRPDCPVCQQQQPIWDEFIENNKNQDINFKKIDTKEISNKDIVDLFNIKTVPTIVVVASDSNIVYSQSGLHKYEILENVLKNTFEYETQQKSK